MNADRRGSEMATDNTDSYESGPGKIVGPRKHSARLFSVFLFSVSQWVSVAVPS